MDRGRTYTYAEVDRVSTNLALNLLDAGLRTLDRVVVQLPNGIEFIFFYFALQKIGCVPIAALVTHRYLEVSQFAELSGATTCVVPGRLGDFEFQDMAGRVKSESSTLRHVIVLGDARPGFVSLLDLISRPAIRSTDELKSIKIDPCDPAVFQLSGGTTGIPKLNPRSHNDYAYRRPPSPWWAPTRFGRPHRA